MGLVYKNRMIINQRGGSIDIDNTTEQEKIKLSHRSGSNFSMTNVVNAELATNNKQINVVNDSFETVGNDKSVFVAGNHTVRTGGSSFHLKGFIDQPQLDAFSNWKDAYEGIAKINSEFKIMRGGDSYPNGTSTSQGGSRASNPVLGSIVYTVNNTFNGYSGVPLRRSDQDDVATYIKVPDAGNTQAAAAFEIVADNITLAAGSQGSSAPGVLEFGVDLSAATEGGSWSANTQAQSINNLILGIQPILNPIEQQMGEGGDETYFTKRNKFEQVGAVFNDYPSIRIDHKGRSQPLEVLVTSPGVFKNHDYIPHVEDVDNTSNFPCGNDDGVVGNRLSRIVGSGGIQLKSTGPFEFGGSTMKVGFKRININASHGIQIASEESVEIQSLKTITLRTNRQVYVESALGVKGNLIVGGGAYVEGELYCQHITAPLEVHQTQDTTVFGKFSTESSRSLLIGEAEIGGQYYPVYALPTDNLLVTYPHSHHHNGIPMRLTKRNKDVRDFAALEGINTHNNVAQSLPQNHERKEAQFID
jgi:hypothetical protein